MSVKSQLRGHAIGAFLGPTGQRISRLLRHIRAGGLPGRGGVEVYHDPSDPISHLLLHNLARKNLDLPGPVALFAVPPPAEDVDPAPADRRAYRLADAVRLARLHHLPFPQSPVRPRAEDVRRVRAVLSIARPFPEHLDLARRLGDALWSADTTALTDRLQGLPTSDTDHTARMRVRGFYAGGALYFRGEWFPDLDRFPHFEADLAGLPVPPLTWPEAGVSTATVDVYFSFRSPYSYLALERLFAIADRTGATLRLRPVLPMVMRSLAVPRIKRLYLVQDAAREARRHGIPFGRIADPLGVGVERCLAIMHALTHPTARRTFARIATRGIWSEALDVATDPDLRIICDRANISWSVVQDALVDASWRQAADRYQADLRAAGVWGVPSFVVDDHAIWGQDRLDVLAEHLTATARVQ